MLSLLLFIIPFQSIESITTLLQYSKQLVPTVVIDCSFITFIRFLYGCTVLYNNILYRYTTWLSIKDVVVGVLGREKRSDNNRYAITVNRYAAPPISPAKWKKNITHGTDGPTDNKVLRGVETVVLLT